MADLSPSEWFDQFPPNPEMDQHGQWCARHWAPCPVLHANGIQATLLVMEQFLERVLAPAGITPSDFEAANVKLAETGRLCCWLGDEEMYRIWGQCPPVSQGHN
jgi:hypothetical protein